jgi:hypothetical protein
MLHRETWNKNFSKMLFNIHLGGQPMIATAEKYTINREG